MDTNASESFNAVLKRLQEWKEVPLDVIAQGCEQLCSFFDVELLRGRYDLVTYRLRKELRKYYCREDDKPIFRKVTPLDDIVTNLRLGLAKLKQQVENKNIDLAFRIH